MTVVGCMSANGPCLIYPRKLMKQELIDEAPTGTLGIGQGSGWMTTTVYYKWLHHFQTLKAKNEMLWQDGGAVPMMPKYSTTSH